MKSAHFTVLDGLRGVAAIAVLLLHASFEFHLTSQPAHAALAVDFFFCLSGFVIAHAYDGAFASGRLTLRTFIRKRIERLYPMILAGTALGAVMAVLSATNGSPKPLWEVGVLTLSCAALLPTGILFGLQAFPVNNPLWSLFFEGLASLGYGVVGARRPSRKVVGALLAASALAVVAAAVLGDGVNYLGFEHSYWFAGGMARVAFPFLTGVLISRLGLAMGRAYCPDIAIAALLALVLLGPSLGPNWLYDAGAILLVFPTLVMLGARARPGHVSGKVWKLLGDISYPLYAIHQPILMGVSKLQNHALHLQSPTLVAALGVVVAIPASWLAFHLYDVPVRKWLGATRPTLRPMMA